VDVNLVLVDATGEDEGRSNHGDLKQDDFELSRRWRHPKIEVFSRDELPLNVALVLDLSDSIGPFLGPLRDAAHRSCGTQPEDEVALFTFSTEAELRVPFTNDKTEIARQINSFHVGGATNINDGILSPPSISSTRPEGPPGDHFNQR